MRESEDKMVNDRSVRMINAAKRLRMVGKFMELSGTTSEGTDFDWAAYRGKVVLIDFWASWCGNCLAEMPNIEKNRQEYGDRSFAVVVKNLDKTTEHREQWIEIEGMSWPSLFSGNEGEQVDDNPIAGQYGIMAVPTAILVDQRGKVVSLSARGKNPDDLLAELLARRVRKGGDLDDATSRTNGTGTLVARGHPRRLGKGGRWRFSTVLIVPDISHGGFAGHRNRGRPQSPES